LRRTTTNLKPSFDRRYRARPQHAIARSGGFD
jgi:hypothetical protein